MLASGVYVHLTKRRSMGPSMPSSDTWKPLGAPRAPHLGPWGPQEGSGCQKRACPHSTHSWGPKGPVFCWIFSAPRAPKAEPFGPHQWAIWVAWGPLGAPGGPSGPLEAPRSPGPWGRLGALETQLQLAPPQEALGPKPAAASGDFAGPWLRAAAQQQGSSNCSSRRSDAAM